LHFFSFFSKKKIYMKGEIERERDRKSKREDEREKENEKQKDIGINEL
jgi:hypothetical protein